MHLQPNRDYDSNDEVQTPIELAEALVKHFQPSGRVLEPCRGDGNFYRFLPSGTEWCEINEGRDFLQWTGHVDWIVTNPPWSKIRSFLWHAMNHADNVVFLLTINHIWTKARIRDIAEAGFGIREICLVDMPPSFPQSGFQLGAVHVQRGWKGEIKLGDLTTQSRPQRARKNGRKPVLPPPVAIFEGVA